MPNVAEAELLARLEVAERELAALRDELESRHRLATVGTIAGLIAHEFNNILTPMLGFAQMALARPEDQGLARRALERCHDSGERAAKIATALLTLLRGHETEIEALSAAGVGGSRDAEIDEVAEIGAALDQALACLARDLGRDGIALARELSPGAERVAIRRVALEHVLLNLILNARKAMLRTSARAGAQGRTGTSRARHQLTVRAVPVSDARAREQWGGASLAHDRVAGQTPCAWVLIEVEDNGPGMSPERVARLFTPLATSRHSGDDHLGGTTTGAATGGGTGLGMTVCRRLIEQAGGRLGVRSTPGQGTTVWMLLPAAGSHSPDGGAG